MCATEVSISEDAAKSHRKQPSNDFTVWVQRKHISKNSHASIQDQTALIIFHIHSNRPNNTPATKYIISSGKDYVALTEVSNYLIKTCDTERKPATHTLK